MTRKILVTGGAGYIGSHVLNLLGKKGYEITVIDDLSKGRKESILYGKHLQFSLDNVERLEEVLQKEKFEAVFHFAGSIVVPESVEKPLEYYQNNTVNSKNLIELAIKYNVKNFIFSSTAAVYGIPAEGLCTETTRLDPISPYGRSKLMTEYMLEDASNANIDFNYVALRYFNVAGGNAEGLLGQCSKESTHLIKIACETALGKRKSMSIFGTDYDTPDGTCIRDYIHVDDLAMAHLLAFDFLSSHQKSEVINCGIGKGFSVKEVIDSVKRVSGVSFDVELAGRRDGDPPILLASPKKIIEKFNFSPKYIDLDFIVETALNWEKSL